MLALFVSIILGSSLTGSIFFLLTACMQPVLAKIKAAHRKAIIICNALLMLIPLPWLFGFLFARFAPQNTGTVAQPVQLTPPSAFYSAGQALQHAAQSSQAITEATPKGFSLSSVNILTVIFILYSVIALVLAGVQILRYRHFIKNLMVNSQTAVSPSLTLQYQGIGEELAIKNLPLLLQSPLLSSPILTGFITPRIILPANCKADEDSVFALQHELTHYKSHDMPLKLFFLAVKTLHWFNPVAHILCRRFNTLCEETCDETLATSFSPVQRKAYAVSLLSFTESPLPYLASGFSLPAKQMQARLQKLLKPVRPKKSVVALSFSLFVVLLAGSVFAGCSFSAGSAASASSGLLAPSSVPSSLPPPSSVSVASSLPQSSSSSQPVATSSSASLYISEYTESVILAEGKVEEYTWPVPGHEDVSRGFTQGAHRGIDIIAPVGTGIVATAGGTVTVAEYHESFGNYVTIDHGGGLSSLYAHCESLAVKTGDTVTAGQQIATVGSSGNSAGPQLHLEIKQDDTLLDPAQYVTYP